MHTQRDKNIYSYEYQVKLWFIALLKLVYDNCTEKCLFCWLLLLLFYREQKRRMQE